MRFHQLNPSDTAALARGWGGPSAIVELNAVQISRRLLLLKHVGERWTIDRRIWNDAIAALDRVRSGSRALSMTSWEIHSSAPG
jgi:hypothetical protein